MFHSDPLLISPGIFLGPRGILLAAVVNLGVNLPPLPRIPPLPCIPPRPIFPLLPLLRLRGTREKHNTFMLIQQNLIFLQATTIYNRFNLPGIVSNIFA